MKKGIYTAAVSIIVIAMIVASAINMVSTVEAHEEKSLAKGLMEMKWKMQNTESMMRKSAADALADDGFEQGCTYKQDTIKTKLQGYLTNTLSSSFGSCAMTQMQASGDETNTTITVDVKCTEETENTKFYYKKTFEFHKKITYLAGPPCSVDVKDLGTTECEVDKIIGGGCGL